MGTAWDAGGACDGAHLLKLKCLNCPTNRAEVCLHPPGRPRDVVVGVQWCLKCFAHLGEVLDSGELFFGYQVRLAADAAEQVRDLKSEMKSARAFLHDDQDLQAKLTGRMKRWLKSSLSGQPNWSNSVLNVLMHVTKKRLPSGGRNEAKKSWTA